MSYSRSPDAKSIAQLKTAGIVCIPTVGALKHAIKAVSLGADAVVVQGGEGGGHTGSVATTILLPQVIAALDVPVVAAGGFKDGRGLAAALSFGAAGIAMGTRFLLTQESPVPITTKDYYLNTTTEQVIVSSKLDGIPQRMINNQYLKTLEAKSTFGMLLLAIKNGVAFAKLSGDSLFSMLRSAWAMKRSSDLNLGQTMMAANAPMMIQHSMVDGHADQGIMPSGQIAGTIDDLPTVEDLICSIVDETKEVVSELAEMNKANLNQQ